MSTPGSAEVAVADRLLLLAVTDPAAARLAARELAASTRSGWLRSVAHHATGLALREQGDLAGALPQLRKALRWAVAAGDADRSAEVRATLGATHAMAGRGRVGLAQLDRAVGEAGSPGVRGPGADAPRVRALARARSARGRAATTSSRPCRASAPPATGCGRRARSTTSPGCTRRSAIPRPRPGPPPTRS